mmetsp:Transcript_43247/g.99692  ORF Transcript_43247/g.99692 Transcript_43247/m.99692 type:complete len:551 (+) Transcript_43247:52-1704(+)
MAQIDFPLRTRLADNAAARSLHPPDPQQLACSGCFTRSRFDDAAQGAAPLLAACGGGALAGRASQRRQKRRPLLAGGQNISSKLSGQAEAVTAAATEPQMSFGRARTQTFIGMVVGYAVYYFTRLSFNYVGPVLRQEMGLSMVQLGAVSSIFPLAYMNSKFVSGVLSDWLGSPVLIFSIGLILTGIMNIGFAAGSTVPWFTVFWVANGLFQGCGATPCNKMLVNWYPAVTRGQWWSGWNASHNIGGFLIPLLAGGLAAVYGWRYGMVAPGIIAIFTGFFTLAFMKDSPEKLGLPSAEAYAASKLSVDADGKAIEEANSRASDDDDGTEAVWKLLVRNRFLWAMAAMHFFVYFIRQGVLNWAHFYIMDEFGVAAAEATARVSGFELGGLFGCIISGQVSDKLIAKRPKVGAAGLRTQVMVAFSLLGTVSVAALWLLPPVAALQWFAMFAFGFAIYGPQTLITMTGVETVPRRAAATAGGLLAYPAQMGSIAAGLPFALLVRRYGWRGFFPALVVLSLISAAVVLPCLNTPSYIQVQAQKSQEAASDAVETA